MSCDSGKFEGIVRVAVRNCKGSFNAWFGGSVKGVRVTHLFKGFFGPKP